MSSKSFDWKSLQKFLDPEAANDFSRFMDKMPGHVGQGALIAAGIAWATVAALGLFTVMQAKELTELRATLETTEALKPLVPTISSEPVSTPELTKLATTFKDIYPTLTVTANSGALSIKSNQTADFAQFREAMGHVVNGGKGWQVTVDSMCVGRECQESGLGANLKIQKLKIDKPAS
ncbi:MAG TPA: hypothetical protein DCM27_08255 [Rhodospirillaceae bacterium]|nr:hypothetical protein [Rhodospirillaceae bacterium]